MKKAVAFLLALFIFVAPVTTFVKADVVIGDNDNIVVNDNANILGRKLAMLESLSELALSGVTEFSISNTNDVDSYLDSLWSEINDAIDYLDSGEWVNDIPNNVASKYYTNLVKYRDIVNNRGQMLGFDFQNPATSLLSTYFANDIYGKKYTSSNLYGSLDMFQALSRINNSGSGEQPQPDIDYSFISNVNNMFVNGINIIQNGDNITYYHQNDWAMQKYFDFSNVTLFGSAANNNHIDIEQTSSNYFSVVNGLITIYLTTNQDNTVSALYQPLFNSFVSTDNLFDGGRSGYYNMMITYNQYSNKYFCMWSQGGSNINFQTSFAGLSTAINYIYSNFYNINLYVDNVLWVSSSNISSNNPVFDIDGYIKIFGNDTPQEYELQPNTQIDYDELYQVIYNAIRDNLPISKDDITYYDSHDNIYSPTLINNYGDEDGDESDLIDTILDYAVIPSFDTAIAQPMRQALTNGVVIMNNSITNVIPQEILLVLGACFFLLLFAVVINRMIK